jgi:hypothetical protein
MYIDNVFLLLVIISLFGILMCISYALIFMGQLFLAAARNLKRTKHEQRTLNRYR